MLLSGNRIIREHELGGLRIVPFNLNQVNPNSYNVRLHNKLVVYRPEAGEVLDMAKECDTEVIHIPASGLVLQPGKLYLGRTVEFTECPCFAPKLDGRSSIGRLGLMVHITAAWGDVNFKGHWTFELAVIEPLRIYAGVCIGQISFSEVDQEGPLYAGKYGNEKDSLPKPSGLWREFQLQSTQSSTQNWVPKGY